MFLIRQNFRGNGRFQKPLLQKNNYQLCMGPISLQEKMVGLARSRGESTSLQRGIGVVAGQGQSSFFFV
jgi:hypothetical protein